MTKHTSIIEYQTMTPDSPAIVRHLVDLRSRVVSDLKTTTTQSYTNVLGLCFFVVVFLYFFFLGGSHFFSCPIQIIEDTLNK